ncbi:hypothetical protein CL620_03755 [archaeon]|nr:hypothetical protein [archaeon]
MRLTSNKIEEILVGILGEAGLPLIRQLIGKENVSEFDLATKTRKDIKVVRKMLYLLYNHNLVGFTRKKDKQKGWYIYYWTLLPDSIRFSYFKTKRDLVIRLNELLEREHKELFFACPNDCVRLNFDESIDFEFHCPECGELLAQDDSTKRIAQLQAKIKEAEGELAKLHAARQARRKLVQERAKKQIAKRKAALRREEAKKEREKEAKKRAALKKKADAAKKRAAAKKKKAAEKAKKATKKKVPKKKAAKKSAKKKAAAKVKKKKVLKRKAATKRTIKKKAAKKKVVKKKAVKKKTSKKKVKK